MAAEPLRTDAHLEGALRASSFLLFKHSHRCPVSARAFDVYQAFCARRPDVPTGWFDVVEQRVWAQRVALESGVRHESPQVLWIRAGRVAWHASHGGITAAALDGLAPRQS